MFLEMPYPRRERVQRCKDLKWIYTPKLLNHARLIRQKRGCMHPLPFICGKGPVYGTVKGLIPSYGNIPVGPLAVEGCARKR
jgi:hypothetical protein